MPTPEAWASAIVEAGFPAELDADFDIDTFSGFLPCRYAGVDAGFEYFAGPPESDEIELPSGVDFAVTLATHAEMRELAASTVAVAVLASLTGGLLYDPQAGLTIAAGDALEWARDQLDEIEL